MTLQVSAAAAAHFLEAVADYLRGCGFQQVSVEFPGIVAVWAEDLIDHPDYAWWFGTNNATWMGDLNTGTGDYVGETLVTDVDSTEPDPLVVGRAIEQVLKSKGAA